MSLRNLIYIYIYIYIYIKKPFKDGEGKTTSVSHGLKLLTNIF